MKVISEESWGKSWCPLWQIGQNHHLVQFICCNDSKYIRFLLLISGLSSYFFLWKPKLFISFGNWLHNDVIFWDFYMNISPFPLPPAHSWSFVAFFSGFFLAISHFVAINWSTYMKRHKITLRAVEKSYRWNNFKNCLVFLMWKNVLEFVALLLYPYKTKEILKMPRKENFTFSGSHSYLTTSRKWDTERSTSL